MKTDRWLILAGVVGLLASIYFLVRYNSPSAVDKSVKGDPVAEVVRDWNDVRVRPEEDPAYRPLKTSDRIFNRDTVFTGEQSEADILLRTGAKINLGPNSLIMIHLSDVNLLEGRLTETLDERSKLIVDQGGTKKLISGKDAKVEVAIQKSGDVEVSVVFGQAQLVVNEKVQELKANQQAQITPQGEVASIKSFSVELVSPAADAKLWVKQDEPVSFEWKTEAPMGEYQLEVAAGRDFSTPLFRKNLNTTSFAAPIASSPNPLYWRVVAKTKDGQEESLIRKFMVSLVKVPRLLAPQNQTTLAVTKRESTENQFAQPTLTWEDESGASTFQIQLSNSPSFAELMLDEEVDKKSIEAPELKPGRYYWRVRATDKNRLTEWSPVFTFSVKGTGPLPPPEVPTQQEFEIESRLKQKSYFQPWVRLLIDLLGPTISFAQDTKKKGPHLVWTPVLGATLYNIEIAEDAKFKNTLVKESVNTPAYLWESSSPGTFYWRVNAVDADGIAGRFSAAVQMNISVAPPKPKRTATVTNEEAVLEWKESKFAKSYEIEWRDPGGAVQKLKANDSDVTVTLPKPGVYAWRVRALDDEGDPISCFTGYQSFKFIVPTPPKAEPVPVEEPEIAGPPQYKWDPRVWIGARQSNLHETTSTDITDTSGLWALPELGLSLDRIPLVGSWQYGASATISQLLDLNGVSFSPAWTVGARLGGRETWAELDPFVELAAESFSQGAPDRTKSGTPLPLTSRQTLIGKVMLGAVWRKNWVGQWTELSFGGFVSPYGSSKVSTATASQSIRGFGGALRTRIGLSEHLFLNAGLSGFSLSGDVKLSGSNFEAGAGWRF